MPEKYPRWTYVVIFALLALVVVLAARAFRGKKDESAAPAPRAEKNATAAAVDKDRQIEDLNIELAQLRNDVEASAKRVRELESKLDETKKALGAAQQKLKAPQKPTGKVAAAPAPREIFVAKSVPPEPPPAARRPAETGSYEIIRDTAVREKPSPAAREVALVQKGTIIDVVGSQGDWLEVRSRYEKPPGYIRSNDARLKQGDTERK